MGIFGLRDSPWSFSRAPSITSLLSVGVGGGFTGQWFSVRNDRNRHVHRLYLGGGGPAAGVGMSIPVVGSYELDSESEILFGANNHADNLKLADFVGKCIITVMVGGFGYGGTAMLIYFNVPSGEGDTVDAWGWQTDPVTAAYWARAVGAIASTRVTVTAGLAVANWIGGVTAG